VPSSSRFRQLTGEDEGTFIHEDTGKYPVTQCDIAEDSNLHPT